MATQNSLSKNKIPGHIPFFKHFSGHFNFKIQAFKIEQFTTLSLQIDKRIAKFTNLIRTNLKILNLK